MKTLTAIGSALALSLRLIAADTSVVSWEKAHDAIGKEATIEGAIVAVRKTGKICNLNFSENWKKDFSAVIFASSFSKWSGGIEAQYRGKKVRITGKVTEYQGRPQIVVTEPSQIVVVNGAAPAAAAATPTISPVTAPSLSNSPPTVVTITTQSNTPPVSAPSVAPQTVGNDITPVRVEVKRFSGARQGSGVVTKTGASFFQTVRLDVTISNTRSAPVGSVDWQWVIGTFDVSSSGDTKQQFFTGGEQHLELKPLERKQLHTDDIALSGMSTNQGMKSGQKLRGHYVRVLFQGRLVFEDANPPNMKSVAESYLQGSK